MNSFMYRFHHFRRSSRHQPILALVLVTLVLILMLVTLMRVEASGGNKHSEPGDGHGGGGVSAGITKGAAIRLYTLFSNVDITTASGACMKYGKYFDLIKYYYRGWKIVGAPFLEGGRWYIKITRTVSY